MRKKKNDQFKSIVGNKELHLWEIFDRLSRDIFTIFWFANKIQDWDQYMYSTLELLYIRESLHKIKRKRRRIAQDSKFNPGKFTPIIDPFAYSSDHVPPCQQPIVSTMLAILTVSTSSFRIKIVKHVKSGTFPLSLSRNWSSLKDKLNSFFSVLLEFSGEAIWVPWRKFKLFVDSIVSPEVWGPCAMKKRKLERGKGQGGNKGFSRCFCHCKDCETALMSQ